MHPRVLVHSVLMNSLLRWITLSPLYGRGRCPSDIGFSPSGPKRGGEREDVHKKYRRGFKDKSILPNRGQGSVNSHSGWEERTYLLLGDKLYSNSDSRILTCIQITWRSCEEKIQILSQSLEKGQDLAFQTRPKVMLSCWSMGHALKNKFIVAKVLGTSHITSFLQSQWVAQAMAWVPNVANYSISWEHTWLLGERNPVFLPGSLIWCEETLGCLWLD